MLEPKDGALPQETWYWEDDEGFRSTFLRYFSREEAAALRRVGNLLYSGALESNAEPHDAEPSFVQSDLRAARADLLFLQAFLASLGAIPEAELVDSSEYRLCRLAAKLSGQVGKLAEDIARALGLPPKTRPEPPAAPAG